MTRFDRVLPLAGVLAGILFFVGLLLTRGDPSSETGPAKTFAYWADDRGKHQIVGLILAPLIAFLLILFGAAVKSRIAESHPGSALDSVAFGGALAAGATFIVVAMLEGGMTNAAHEGERGTVYTLNQMHSYDWLGWNISFAALLLATGLAALRNKMLPTALAWASVAIGVSLLTPLGFFGFFLVPAWLLICGALLYKNAETRSAVG